MFIPLATFPIFSPNILKNEWEKVKKLYPGRMISPPSPALLCSGPWHVHSFLLLLTLIWSGWDCSPKQPHPWSTHLENSDSVSRYLETVFHLTVWIKGLAGREGSSSSRLLYCMPLSPREDMPGLTDLREDSSFKLGFLRPLLPSPSVPTSFPIQVLQAVPASSFHPPTKTTQIISLISTSYCITYFLLSFSYF